MPRQPALTVEPVQLIDEQEQRGHRRCVVGLILARVVDGGGQVEERGNVASDAAISSTRCKRRWGHRGEPEPAIGREALLRGEVVDVELTRVDGQPPAAEVASTRTSASASAFGTRRMVMATPVDVSLCVYAYASTPSSATGSGCVPGFASRMDGVASQGAADVTGREPRRELTEGQVLRAALDEPVCGDVPERRGAAVAQHDLVTIRQVEQGDDAVAHALDE